MQLERSPRRCHGLALSFLIIGCLVSASAEGAGLYFSDRGVRGLARGGAFIAGADDAGAIYYNPAGLAFTGHQLLIDAAWLNYNGSYRRSARLEQTDPNTGEPTGQSFIRNFPTVEGTSPLVPIPMLAYANPLGSERWNFALGAWAPYAAITSYPETIRGNPAPQRYSLISLDGSALAVLGAYASWKPIDELAFGLGVEALGGFFEASVAFSACVPDRFICAPEQPDYDAITKMRVGPIITPSGILGAIWAPSDALRVGASYHLPFNVNSEAEVRVRLPSAPVFSNASQRGDGGQVEFALPGVVRGGVEYRGIKATRVELAMVWENWGAHDSIRLSPSQMSLVGVEAFPHEYQIGDIELERNFQNAYSIRLGGEHRIKIGGYPFDIRAGIMYETSAIPKAYLSTTTVDLNKVILGFGGGLHIGKWRLDGVVAPVFALSQDVGVDEARISQVTPLRSNPPERPNYINAGRYEARALVLGVGLSYQFDSSAEAPSEPREGSGTFRLQPKPGIQPDEFPSKKNKRSINPQPTKPPTDDAEEGLEELN